jgi:hypothetical protein
MAGWRCCRGGMALRARSLGAVRDVCGGRPPRLTTGQDTWGAGCVENRTSGSRRRLGETDRWQYRHRAPGRPHKHTRQNPHWTNDLDPVALVCSACPGSMAGGLIRLLPQPPTDMALGGRSPGAETSAGGMGCDLGVIP